MIYRLLYKLLHDSAAIAARVGTRIFAENAPTGTQGACIVLRVLGGDPEYSLVAETDCANPSVQIDAYDESSSRAQSLYELIRNRISGYSGSLSVLGDDGLATTVTIHELQIIRPGSLIEEPRDASDRWTYRWSSDCSLFHSQSVPTLT